MPCVHTSVATQQSMAKIADSACSNRSGHILAMWPLQDPLAAGTPRGPRAFGLEAAVTMPGTITRRDTLSDCARAASSPLRANQTAKQRRSLEVLTCFDQQVRKGLWRWHS